MFFNKISLIILLVISTTTLAKNSAPERFYWVDDHDFPPFIYLGDNNKPTGIFKTLMDEIFSELNLTLDISLYPWKRAQAMMEQGLADGFIAFPTATRLKTLYPSDPLFNVDMHLFYVDSNPLREKIESIKTIADLSNFMVVSYNGDGWSKQHLDQKKLIVAPNYTSALQMFARGRADIFIDNGITMKYYMAMLEQENPNLKQYFSKIKMSKIILDSTPFCLLLDKKKYNSQFIAQYNTILKKLKDSGFIARTLALKTVDMK